MFVALHTETQLTVEQQRLFNEFTAKAGLTPTSVEEVDHHKRIASIVDTVINGSQKWDSMPVALLNDITSIDITLIEQVRIHGADICVTIDWKGQHGLCGEEVNDSIEFLIDLSDSIEMEALEHINGAIFGVVFGKNIPSVLLDRIVNGEIDFPSIDDQLQMRNDIANYGDYIKRIKNRDFPSWGTDIEVGYDS